MPQTEELKDYLEKEVVVDSASSYIYLGRLAEVTENYITLTGADVHDMADSRSTKELYIMEARKHGIQPNRAAVKIKKDTVASLSLLADVLLYG